MIVGMVVGRELVLKISNLLLQLLYLLLQLLDAAFCARVLVINRFLCHCRLRGLPILHYARGKSRRAVLYSWREISDARACVVTPCRENS